MQIVPAPPRHVTPLCCEILLMVGVSAGTREMEWAPSRLFSTDGGVRRQTGWAAEWCCNSCGRTLSAVDPLLRAGEDRPVCACGRNRDLVLDFMTGRHEWRCPQNSCLPLPAEDVSVGNPSTMPPDGGGTITALVGSGGFFDSMPPRVNREATNSFLYCPLLLHAASLQAASASESWSRAARWFPDVARLFGDARYDMRILADAYVSLINVALSADPHSFSRLHGAGEIDAASSLSRLATSYPVMPRAICIASFLSSLTDEATFQTNCKICSCKHLEGTSWRPHWMRPLTTFGPLAIGQIIWQTASPLQLAAVQLTRMQCKAHLFATIMLH